MSQFFHFFLAFNKVGTSANLFIIATIGYIADTLHIFKT